MEQRWTKHIHINAMISLFEAEQQPFRKIHRLIDLFETVIKTHTAMIIANYFSVKDISEQVKALLSEGLKVPSLGLWQLFSKVIMDEMVIQRKLSKAEFYTMLNALQGRNVDLFKSAYDEAGDSFCLKLEAASAKKQLRELFLNHYSGFNKIFFIEDFHNYFYKWNKKVERVITLRNEYAHGATPCDEKCMEDIEMLMPLIEEILSAKWLQDTKIIAFKNHRLLELLVLESSIDVSLNEEILRAVTNNCSDLVNYHPYLVDSKGRVLDLFPILSCKVTDLSNPNTYSIVFFNDLKRKKEISLLNYPKSLHFRDKQMYEEFLSVINIEKWKYHVTSEFRERILELTELFKGRVKEKKNIREFIDSRDRGVLAIFGSPGIGKSALIAKIIREENLNKSSEEKRIYQLEYFIRRGTIHARPDFMLDYLNRGVENFYKTDIPMGNSLEEKRVNLHLRLRTISEQLVDKKLVIFVDGLDEGIEGGILNHLITESYKNIIVVYSSRPVRESEIFYRNIPYDYKDRFDIDGLNKEDIRAILYEVVNKYDLKEALINLICQKSQGNPLYIKLLCSKLETLGIQNFDESKLVDYIEDFYYEILCRLKETENLVLEGLYVIASASDYISEKQLEFILNISEKQSAYIISLLQEVLFENPHMENSYQLFHESFREYLFKSNDISFTQARLKLIDYCRRWKEFLIYKNYISSYTLKHFSKHLVELELYDELYSLTENSEYIEAQLKVTGQYESTFELYMNAYRIAKKNKEYERALKIGTSIGQLHIGISNSIKTVMSEIKLKDKDIAGTIEKINDFTGWEKFVLYINLIHSKLFGELSIFNRKELLEKILESFHTEWLDSFKNVNWYEYLSISYIIRMLRKVDSLEIDIKPLINVFSYNENMELSLFSDKIDFKDYKDYEIYKLIILQSDKIYREKMIPSIAKELIKIGYPHEVLNLIDFVSDEYLKFDLMYQAALYLVDKNSLEEACEIIKNIEDQYYYSKAQIEVIKKFVKEGNSEKAREMAVKLPEYFVQEGLEAIDEEINGVQGLSLSVQERVIEYAENNEIDQALELYKNIVSYEIKVETAKSLCKYIPLGNRSYVDVLLAPINTVYAQAEVRGMLASEAAKQGEVEYALEMINLIEVETEKNDFKKVVSGLLLEAGCYDKSIELINSVSKIVERQDYLPYASYLKSKAKSESNNEINDASWLEKEAETNYSLEDKCNVEELEKLIKEGSQEKLFSFLESLEESRESSKLLFDFKDPITREEFEGSLNKDNLILKFENVFAFQANILNLIRCGEIEFALSLCKACYYIELESKIEKILIREALKAGKTNEIMQYTNLKSDFSARAKAKVDIANYLSELGKIDQANSIMNDVIGLAKIDQKYDVILYAVIPILEHSIKKGDRDKIQNLLNEAKQCIFKSKKSFDIKECIKRIVELLKQNSYGSLADNFIFNIANNIYDKKMITFLMCLFEKKELYTTQFDRFLNLMEPRLQLIAGKDNFYSEAAGFLFEYDEYNKANEIIDKIRSKFVRSLTNINISAIIFDKGNKVKAFEVLNSEIINTCSFEQCEGKTKVLKRVFRVLIKFDMKNRIYEILDNINNDEYRKEVIINALLPEGKGGLLEIINYVSNKAWSDSYKNEIYMEIVKLAKDTEEDSLQILTELFTEIYSDKKLVWQWLYSSAYCLKNCSKLVEDEDVLLQEINKIINYSF
ncbi:hypothetical protein CFOLD11_11700 [Clostridium folliculivorans]|uniref:Uncharacterized protein n=1 Tax=Clostridium folliculivorans TaxID=2886038 RepID=A0A9W6D9N8_9CLOT|nr:hypothetical protein [Clostridium folliculivorans]GKU24344.1 hypothetical protein CFOLD11_11700 [Clostridium folliculivorans]